MSRLEVPLLGKTLRTTGEILLRAELDLLLQTNARTWEQVLFRVDSGTEMTTLPASQARQLDLPLPAQPVPGLHHAQTGLPIRAGGIRAQILGMDGTEYVFPCYFLGDPSAPLQPSPPITRPRYLLGLTGVVDQIRILFDGQAAPHAPHGVMVIEKR